MTSETTLQIETTKPYTFSQDYFQEQIYTITSIRVHTYRYLYRLTSEVCKKHKQLLAWEFTI